MKLKGHFEKPTGTKTEHQGLGTINIALIIAIIAVASVAGYLYAARGSSSGSELGGSSSTSSTTISTTSSVTIPNSTSSGTTTSTSLRSSSTLVSSKISTTTSSKDAELVVVDIVSGAHLQSQGQHYVPDTIVVQIGVNNTITWINQDTTPHTVTAFSNAFNSGTIIPGSNFTMTFATPGTYQYHCNIHPFMSGTVEVLNANGQAVSQSTSSTTSTQSTTTISTQSTTTSDSSSSSSCSYYYAGVCY